MIGVDIVCVGSMKSEFKLLSQEYEKRLSKYCKLNVIEVGECKLSDNPSVAEITKALDVEGQNILKNVKGTLIVLDSHGKMMTSEELATFVKCNVDGGNNLTFVIGSSYGLSDSVKHMASTTLSFSKFTFPHQLMRIILEEQLFRSMCIINNKTYHK